MEWLWQEAISSFRIAFATVLIASVVVVITALVFDWRSALIGICLGAWLGMALAASLTGPSLVIVQHRLDGASIFVLLAFGFHLNTLFVADLARPPDLSPPRTARKNSSFRIAGIGSAAWVVLMEGLEIIPMWLESNFREASAAASLGAFLSVFLMPGLAAALVASGTLRKLPEYAIHGIGPLAVTSCGAFFLARWAAASYS